MDGVKVVFFDMGNTLLHFHYGESDEEKDMQGLIYLTEYLNKFNENIKFDEVKQGFYTSWMNGIRDRKITHIEYPIEDFLNNFLQKYQVSLDLKQCIEAIHLFYTEYREQVYFENDIYDVLKMIKHKGYKIGIISNTCYYDEVMKACFKKAKIYDLIDSFTFSYSLRIGKPNKEIFTRAIDAMKITPQEAIMVGDSLESDIKPAIDLGMKTIWLNRESRNINKEVMADIEISCISEIYKHIETWR
ncbi:putative hydrolase of the HAD superfamily [Anaerosolibacter carboniphilus]|uniref:Putative hydrolase of the HAD superfamily n=1 Tax=Anaerosolibacter carboniphilus TaxID=1417629 RepID=A0A841KUU2_9FIRM|nr:HAD family hydrolase [Anaerosolibacter carboniphilus]MBB6217464.1 putative hydrolase of the HAD superfamily [Anaerosolibacter carboniphilus]